MVTYHDFDFCTEDLEANNIQMHRISQKGNPLTKLLAVRKLMNKQKYDVVIAYKSGVTMLACILKMLGGRFRLIVSERNTTQALTKRERLKFWLYKYSDYIVPNSYTQEEFIKGHYPALTKKTVTITNFTDTTLFSPSDDAKSNGTLRILTVARVATQKNVIRYIEAAKKVRDAGVNAVFHWFGNVQIQQDDYARQCQERVKELGLADVFKFHPATNDILSEYQKCDIFCLPSLYEGYPNVVCEAMSCGKPILCSRVCDNPHIVEDDANGMMFNPVDEDEMARIIIKMCKLSEEQRAAMGKRSREIAEEKFSSKAFVEKYTQLIEA
jgi:glycosyltransferase involved in cell wall biosynthesis